MSNFSQFFPAGSGGSGGSGGGINSYAPFLVGTADNNPQGYIASTGLYTNPVDDSVWLKTGNTLVDTAVAYPNAKYLSGLYAYNSTLTVPTGFRGITYNPNTNKYYGGRQSTQIKEYDSSFALTGNVFDVSSIIGSSQIDSLAYDATLDKYFIAQDGSSGVVYRVSNTFTNESISLSIANQGIEVVGSELLILDESSIKYYNTSNLSASGTSTATIPAVYRWGICYNGSFIYIRQGSVVEEYTVAGVATGRTFSTSSTTPNFDMTIGENNDIYIAELYPTLQYYPQGAATVGDDTAKTSAMGDGQPLFIKLK